MSELKRVKFTEEILYETENAIIMLDVFAHSENAHVVMHNFEHPIMEEHAKVITKNGGDILEIGFGMGIFADYVQSSSINSHTIVENHPQIIGKLIDWSKDKPNVKIISQSWYEAKEEGLFEKYDGIFFDTYGDDKFRYWKDCIQDGTLTKKGTVLSWYNGVEESTITTEKAPLNGNPYNHEIPDTLYYPIEVPTQKYYKELHTGSVYWIPQKTFI